MLKLQIAVISLMVALSLGLKIPLGLGPVIGSGISDDEAKALLNTALTNMAAKDGPYYTIDGINSAIRRVPWSSNLYEIKADLVDLDLQSKSCNVNIWKNHWESDGQVVNAVVLKCGDDAKVLKSYSEHQN